MGFDRNHFAYNEDGFFNLKGYFNACIGPKWKNRSFSFIFQAPRNIGKSYGVWKFIEEEIWIKSNYEERIVYCRSNMSKLKAIKGFFNSKYAGKYLMTDTHIWKIEIDEESGKELRFLRKELGVVAGVANQENWKSGEFANYRCVFWDEYNEAKAEHNMWENWITLFKTIERFNKPFWCILAGNKVDAGNDILMNLQIEESDYMDADEDIVIERGIINGEPNIYFVDIHNSTFAHLNQREKQANIWASYNQDTNRHLNEGGYQRRGSVNVKGYFKIFPTRKVIYYLGVGRGVYEYGNFDEGSYFHYLGEHPNLEFNNIPILAFSAVSLLTTQNSSAFIDKQDYIDFAEMLVNKVNNNKLFYTSYASKEELENTISRFVSLY